MTAETWMRLKFNETVTDFNPETDIYYKYHVCHFVRRFFTRTQIASRTVLDFGCGPGYYCSYFAEQGAIVTGLTSSPYLIERARKLHSGDDSNPITYVRETCSNATILPHSEYDLILAMDGRWCRWTTTNGNTTTSARRQSCDAFPRCFSNRKSLCN